MASFKSIATGLIFDLYAKFGKIWVNCDLKIKFLKFEGMLCNRVYLETAVADKQENCTYSNLQASIILVVVLFAGNNITIITLVNHTNFINLDYLS